MPVIGIIGGISTGKTTFCECLREIIPAATFFDADQAARDLTEHDPEVRESIGREFGPAMDCGPFAQQKSTLFFDSLKASR